MKNSLKRLFAAILCVVMIMGLVPIEFIDDITGTNIKSEAASYEYAIFPMQYLNITQIYDSSFSHKGQMAIDCAGKDSGVDTVFAPYTGKIVKIYAGWNNCNTVFFQSNNPVIFADGTTDYMTMLFMHDDNISDLYVGKEIKQFEPLLSEGKTGNGVTGNHSHMECGKGKFSGSGWYNGSGGHKTINNHYKPEDALFIRDSTIVKNAKGLNFKNIGSYSVTPPTGPSEIILSNETKPTGTIAKGKSFGLYGDISSKYKITKVIAKITNTKTNADVISCQDTPNSTWYSIHGKINNEFVFGKLADGKYRYTVEVYDEKDYKLSPKPIISSTFQIGNGGQGSSGTPVVLSPNPPKISTTAVPGGYSVSISAESGAEIHYTTNNTFATKDSPKYTGPFTVKSSCIIRAVAIKNGVMSGEPTPKSVNVSGIEQPSIIPTITASDYTVVISCATPGARIYYTLDGSTPSVNSYYYSSPLHIQSGTTVRAYAVKEGCADSWCSRQVITVSSPDKPGIEIPTGSDVGVGDPIEIKWTARGSATSHYVRVYRNGTLVDTIGVSGSRYVYIPSIAGTYTFGVDAVNFAGRTGSDSTKSVTVHAHVKVSFVDYDGTLIKMQEVHYGYSATVPQNPKRKGWIFREWDSYGYLNAKQDVTIKALYDREKYVVRFIDEDGLSCAPAQEVEYEGAVTLPDNPTHKITGYKFVYWRTISADNSSLLDYNCVDANLTLQAVYELEDPTLSLSIQSNSATAMKTRRTAGSEQTVYSVSALLNNLTNKTQYFRVLITLKTSTGKAVQTAVRDYHLSPGATKVQFDSGEIICDKVAAKVELNIVGLDDSGDRTGGTCCNSYTINSIIDQAGIYYTDWSQSRTYASNQEETKVMYRYRDREFTTSTATYLSGWEQTGVANISYGGWSGNITTTSKPTASDTLQIVGSPVTTYNYYHYCNYYDNHWNTDSIAYGSSSQYHSFSTTSELPDCPDNILGGDKGGRLSQARGWRNGSPKHSCGVHDKWIWWLGSTTVTYTYQTRSKTTTYNYRKWGSWSGWSDVPMTSSTNREVETATFYRYKFTPQAPTDGEDNSGTVYNNSNIKMLGTSGIIPNDITGTDLSGRKATVIVYKASLNDPTANHIEYVGQITIGSGNTYNISFVPAEEPDEAESNFTVSLAVAGQTSLYNIGTILCSKSIHDVEFFADGESLSKQQVEEGDDAVVPTPPEIPGKTFVGWNNDTTNVIASRNIEAYYVDETYSVVFVDFETDFVSMNQYKYGDIIGIPAADDFDGKTFVGWKGLDMDAPIATENAIYIAEYETGTFEVRFEDGFGNTVSTQTVEYGKAAELPDSPEKDGLIFLGWKQEQTWWNVKNDMTVTPIWVYENTVAAPNISVESLYFGGEITAESDTEGATLYYAVDDGRGEPPAIVSEDEYTEYNMGEELTQSEEAAEPVQALHISPLSLFTAKAYAADEEFEEETEYIDECELDFYDWLEYDGSMIFDEDATIYFYATAENMNDSEVVKLDYVYEPVMNPYEDHTGETHTVIFIDDDGFVLDEQIVDYFEGAIAPEIEERDGYVFTGWDNKFGHVTEDIEVVAQYVPEDEYVTFKLSNEEISVTVGDTYSLSCTVENAPDDMGDIIWTSSNNTVATVSIDGFVITKQAGEAVITAKGDNTNYSASCKVTVLPDINDTVTLRNNSGLSLENGILTQVPVVLSNNRGVAAAVGEIKAQFATPNVKIVDSDGNEMDDSALVATNTQIRIIVDGIVVDAVMVIVTGDYDGNGKVNNMDASRIMRYLVNKETPDEYQLYASDVNKDGVVNNKDAAMLPRYLIGKEVI